MQQPLTGCPRTPSGDTPDGLGRVQATGSRPDAQAASGGSGGASRTPCQPGRLVTTKGWQAEYYAAKLLEQEKPTVTLIPNLDHGYFTSTRNGLVTEASSLGLRATDPTPSELVVSGITYAWRGLSRDRDGDIVCWIYAAPGQPIITVYND